MKPQIVYYKEEGNKFYGFYFNRHFTACSFRFEEDIREFFNSESIKVCLPEY